MVKRLVLGLVIGILTGGLVAAALIAGLGLVAVPAFVGFALAAATGALTGLVAGKPIWASGGQIEAGLKAFFGALLAAGGLYAIRAWLPMHVPEVLVHYLTQIHPGAHADTDMLGDLPGAFLPLLGGVLGGFYELDNTPEAKDDKGAKAKTGGPRVGGTKIRISEDPDEDTEDAAPAAKRRTR